MGLSDSAAGSLGMGVGADSEQEEVQRQGADTRVVGLDDGGLRGHEVAAALEPWVEPDESMETGAAVVG